MIGLGGLTRAVIDGLLAQRKMDGNTGIIAPDDWQTLDFIIRQGKRAEAALRRLDYEAQVKCAYEKAGVKHEPPKQPRERAVLAEQLAEVVNPQEVNRDSSRQAPIAKSFGQTCSLFQWKPILFD